ncbi:DNA mismatch repair protein mutL [Coccidioides posadasii str. Silveira]|uniref:DNA mismatch repair protein mutL n=2 Tax=Coccidioides posadasii (strain RMSCC 757 / Silveira) TaxID=443226 RepID=E9D2C4_COCPS|nr:DNA mismatch repair protein mutL [Coccidioides posadasii str. Silveira]
MEIDGIQDHRGVKRTAADAGFPGPGPRKIQALDPDVVNKIAAGEIIVAPMHALKELIENSVDAGATAVEILVKDGGLKLLQITDNGHGIDSEDLPILCERFTTSKLKAFEDLSSIATYGFRGEALASISHIAHLTVTTKTAGSSCAWRAHYRDGKLVPAKPGQSAEPKPTAGRGGTQITVEDLFYNVPTRRRAFRSASEEYAKILDIVGRYAVHCNGVSFSCKKHGDSGVSVSTPVNSSTIDRIRQIHGSAVANELIPFDVEDSALGFRASGFASNANYHAKRTVILLFINHRSVESSGIRKAMEQTYSAFLPKGGHPFAYLNIEIEPHRVDVNVHPTKREVNFLNEDEIIELICNAVRTKLANVDSSRTFMTQTLLPGIHRSGTPPADTSSPRATIEGKVPLRTVAGSKRPYENNLVRTDVKMRKITSMFPVGTPEQGANQEGGSQSQHTHSYEASGRESVNIRLTSVKNLRAAVRSTMHNSLTDIFSSLTYVGLVDERRRIAAIQSGVKLYLVDYGMVCNEFFYQIGLTDFGNFGVINLESSPRLVDLLSLAAAVERDEHHRRIKAGEGGESNPSNAVNNGDPSNIDFSRVPEIIAAHLIEKREMLNEYFSLSISEDGSLLSIPLLLKNYMPSLAKLPRFLLRLGPYVDWTNEEACFRTFLRELAAFYTPEQLPTIPATPTPPIASLSADGSNTQGERPTQESLNAQHQSETQPSSTPPQKEDPSITRRRTQLAWMLEHILFPAIRSRLVATDDLVRGVVEVADLKGLYRVFERC